MSNLLKELQYYPIGKLCQIIDCEHKTAPYIESSDYLVVRTSNVRDGILIFDDIKYTTKKGFIEWTKRAIPRHGDVLFTREAPAGESCLVPKNFKICIGQRMVLFRPNKNLINSHFLSFYLTSEKCKKEIYKYSIGSTVTRINIDDISKIKIYCPSLEEQEKIASFLDSVALRIIQLRRKHELLETYKKGVMQKIFSQQIRFKQDDGNPFPDWEKKKLKNICSLIKDGTHGTHKDDSNGQFFLLSAKNVFNGRVLYDNNDRKISQAEFLSIYKNYTLEKNDILLSIVGSIGRVAIFDGTNNLAFQRSVAFFRLKKDIPSFIYHQMTSFLFQRELLRRQVVSAQPGIYLGDLGKILVFIPCLEEQEKITNFLTSVDKKIEAVALQIEAMEKLKKGLLQKMFV